MTAPHLPAHGSAAPLIPHSVEHGQTPPPGASSALQGDGGTDLEDFRLACRTLSHLFSRNHARGLR